MRKILPENASVLSGFICAMVLCVGPLAVGDNSKPNKLCAVNAIFIEQFYKWEQAATIEARLEEELEKRGFRIVNDPAAAEAILTGTVSAQYTLDGDERDLPKAIYTVELKNAGGERIWKAGVKFVRKRTFAEDDEHAARKLADKLAGARKKAARRAGVK